MVPGQLHAAAVEHLGALLRHLEHVVVGDGLQLPRFGQLPGVGGVDAVDVGVDVAGVGLEKGGQGDSRGVRAAAAQGRDLAGLGDALEAGDEDDAPVGQRPADAAAGDVVNPGVAEAAVGADAGLPAGQGLGGKAQRMELHGHVGHGDLLAHGEEQVGLPFGRVTADGLGLPEQAVGGVAPGGEDGDDGVAVLPGFRNAPCGAQKTFGAGEGAAAELLNDQCHNNPSCWI